MLQLQQQCGSKLPKPDVKQQLSRWAAQDESSIAAHLGERAPKVADDESVALDQQDETEDVSEEDVAGTGILAVIIHSVSTLYNFYSIAEQPLYTVSIDFIETLTHFVPALMVQWATPRPLDNGVALATKAHVTRHT